MDDLIRRQQAIDKFIDGLEEIFADLRERHVDDSVCGLCEYDGAYIGQSGDWCNECPGFDRDDCFKLSDKTRKKWTNEIIKALPSAQPELCGDVVSRNAIVQKLNGMDRYVSTELRLCDTDKKFPQNEVFIVDDVYEEIVEQLPSAQPFHNITMTDVLKYIDDMPEDVWLEFTECLRCRGWELQWCGGDFA